MSKIQKITIKNFKAISEQEADFKGCTGIVTGGNDKGKTSLLKGIVDRIRFIRPEVMVKRGEKEGSAELILDSNERFEWQFDVKGKDKLTWFSSDNKTKKSVTTELGRKYFPPVFDIDQFLASTPKKQIEQLQEILGVDFTDVDARYQVAYDDRTDKNREAEKFQVKLTQMLKVEPVVAVDLTELQNKKQAERDRLNKLYQENKATNDKLREGYQADCERIRKEVEEYNKTNTENRLNLNAANDATFVLTSLGYVEKSLGDFLAALKDKVTIDQQYTAPELPDYIEEMPPSTELEKIDAEILTASDTNTRAAEYQKYIDHKTATDRAKLDAKEADEKVKAIEEERQKLIQSAKFPKGISITAEGITVDGLPLDRNQIGSSKLYIAALKIGALSLGEVQTLYFDASYLDNKNLKEVEEWADQEGYQLLIEMPDRSAGEIKIELVEETK